MDTEIEYTLNAMLSECNNALNGATSKILTPVSCGVADEERIIAAMKEEDSGLRTETIVHVLELHKRVLKRLLLSGYRVNTGIFYGSAAFRGAIEGSAWDSERNRIVFNLTASNELRTAARSTAVNIVAEKGAAAYISGVQDVLTKVATGTVGAGHHVSVAGHKIKIAGDSASNGIALTNEKGETIAVPSANVTINYPSNIVFLLPATVPEGIYTLSITTQYTNGSRYYLKAPRTVETTIVVE